MSVHWAYKQEERIACNLGILKQRKMFVPQALRQEGKNLNFHQKGKIVIPLDMPLEGKHFLFPMGTATRRETFQFPGNCHQKGKMFVSLKFPPECKNVCSLRIATKRNSVCPFAYGDQQGKLYIKWALQNTTIRELCLFTGHTNKKKELPVTLAF